LFNGKKIAENKFGKFDKRVVILLYGYSGNKKKYG
jgi:hypothetical protein